ncbi:amidohydrolase family protein, partial [Achromobacter xylosoxidans]
VETLLAHARDRGIPTASHDDDSIHRIATMRNLGVAMSEFPITLDTARAAVSCGLPTILGAPNVLRGKSQSGSMRAIDAIRAGVASCLCSDYQPSTLIAAAFAVTAQTDLTLPQAIALVTANPADACGLADRGRIAVGQRADLVAVAQVGALPLISHTWSAGRLVFSTHYAPARAPTPARAAEADGLVAA